MPETNGKLIPFYLVVDVSYSMTNEQRLDNANRLVGELIVAFENNPILSDKVRVSLIDFSDDARVVIPLDDVLALDSIPTLEVRGGTSYGCAFLALRDEIQRNVDELKASRFEVHRPVVYFITDGEPNDVGWETALSSLTDYDKETKSGFSYFPNIIPCGVGDADPAVLAKIIHPVGKMKMFLQKEGGDPAKALPAMIEMIINSMLSSAQSMQVGVSGNALQLPDPADLPDDIEMDGGEDYL